MFNFRFFVLSVEWKRGPRGASLSIGFAAPKHLKLTASALLMVLALGAMVRIEQGELLKIADALTANTVWGDSPYAYALRFFAAGTGGLLVVKLVLWLKQLLAAFLGS